jgi:glycosyltransferase involved in cell wall biosynthesis
MQVTAHFPPDFVSGGVLVPERIARAVFEHGHDSYVFTGALHGLDALEQRDSDANGVKIRWIGVAPFLAWDDEKNYNNPEVASRFAEYVAEISPDIVHFHSIQALGAQILDIAHEAGAKTVLTMHDFWWLCARQFLVDRNFEPCPLVISCGDCACSRNHAWLVKRNQWLFDRLKSIDLILAPSQVAAEALIANGIPGELIRVNENGVDGAKERTVERGPLNRAVRFMYAGGEAELKGYEVLRRACDKARVPEGTVLDLYGASDVGFPEWAHTKPAYSREDLDQVFSTHDVLLLPSIMRESHSIVTREALSAGMAVICTDTLGPEEAVENMNNGLVVKAGSEESLRDAIEWASVPANSSAIIGKGSASRIVTVDEQIKHVLQIYDELAEKPIDGEASIRQGVRALIEKVTFVVGLDGAPTRYRAHIPAEALQTLGIETCVISYRDPAILEEVMSSDAVVFYRVPATYQVLEIIEMVREDSHIIPILGDVDDLIFDPEVTLSLENLDRLSRGERALWRRGVQRYRTTLENCDVFLGSTATISQEAERLIGIPSWTFENGVGSLLSIASEEAIGRARKPGPLRIGYFSGTDTHDADWLSIEPVVAQVMDEHPDIQLWLGGMVAASHRLDAYSGRIVRKPFMPWFKLPQVIRDVDVCLAPLVNNSAFNESKSAIKWLEAALVETPTIASGTSPFRRAISSGETGFIADTPEEWHDSLERLLSDELLRRQIGARAHRSALMRLSPERQGRALLEILVNAWMYVAQHGHHDSSSYRPVLSFEPPSIAASVLEPYALPRNGRVMSSIGGKFLPVDRAVKIAEKGGLRELGRWVASGIEHRVARH